jgi:hypothetical protein
MLMKPFDHWVHRNARKPDHLTQSPERRQSFWAVGTIPSRTGWVEASVLFHAQDQVQALRQRHGIPGMRVRSIKPA